MSNVMGSYPMTSAQTAKADALRADFEALHAKLFPEGTVVGPNEAARLFAIARTDLEKSCAMAIKAVSQ